MLQPKHIIVGLGILLSFNATSQTKEDSLRNLPTVDVTKYPKAVILASDINYSSPRYVLDQSRLAQLGALDLGAAMKYVPGSQIKDYGGIGGMQTISYRSLGSAHTAVSIDDQQIRNTQSGSINLSGFESFGMDHFVFSAGQPKESEALASQYLAANSISMYSIIAGDTDSLRLGVYQNATTINAFESGIYAAVPLKSNFQIGAQFSSRYGSGEYAFDYPLDATGQTERTNSELLRTNSRLYLSKRFKHLKLSASGRHYYNDQQLPGAVILYIPTADQSLKNETARADFDLTFDKGKYKGHLNGFFQNDQTNYNDPSFLNSLGYNYQFYEQTNFGGGGILHRRLQRSAGRVFIGSDYVYSRLGGVEFTIQPERIQSNSVIGYNAEFGPVNLESNLAYQFVNDQYVLNDERRTLQYSRLSPFISLSYRPLKRRTGKKHVFRTRAFYKNTFRLPSFNDLYYNAIGNTELRPESANIFDLGITFGSFGKKGKLEFTLDAFYSMVQDKIVAIPTKDLFNWSMQNIGDARVIGMEFGFSQHASKGKWGWSHTATGTINYSTDITDEDSPSFGHQLPYVPMFAGTASASIGYDGFRLLTNLNYTGLRYSLNENIWANRLEPIFDLNSGLEKTFKMKALSISLSARLMNILGVNYEVIRSYPMPGRYGQFTVRLNYR